MNAMLKAVARAVRALWWWLRQCSGDAAYENYLARHANGEAGADCCERHRCMTAKEFYLDRLRRKYTGVNRCC